MTALMIVTALLALRGIGLLLTHAVCGYTPALYAWHRRLRRSPSEPVYMDRWQLFRSPWLDVYVNRINLPDSDEHPHTHPWRASWSLKLYGSYVERVWYRYSDAARTFSGFALGSIQRTPPRLSRIPWCHRIVVLRGERPAWTLFVGVGRKSGNDWGFIDVRTGELVRKGGSDVPARTP